MSGVERYAEIGIKELIFKDQKSNVRAILMLPPKVAGLDWLVSH